MTHALVQVWEFLWFALAPTMTGTLRVLTRLTCTTELHAHTLWATPTDMACMRVTRVSILVLSACLLRAPVARCMPARTRTLIPRSIGISASTLPRLRKQKTPERDSRLPKKGLLLLLCLCRRQKKATPKSAPAPGCQPLRCFPSTLLLLCALAATGRIVFPRTFDPTSFVPRMKEARLLVTLVRRTSHSAATSRMTTHVRHVVHKGLLALFALQLLACMVVLMSE